MNNTNIVNAQTDFGFGTGSFVVSNYHCTECKQGELGIVIAHRTVIHDIGPEEMYWVIFEGGDAAEYSLSDLRYRTQIYRGRLIQAAKHYQFITRNKVIDDTVNGYFKEMFGQAHYLLSILPEPTSRSIPEFLV